MKTFNHLLSSSFLFFLLLLLLVTPMMVGEFLVIDPFVNLQGQVAGLQNKKLIALYPNLSDFNDYVSFNLRTNETSEFVDELKLTVFRAQIATYQNLYEIYNNTSKPLKVSIITTQAQFDPNFQSLILTLKKPHQNSFTSLQKDTAAAPTLLPVTNLQVFAQDSEYVIVDETAIKKIAQNSEGLVIMPQNRLLTKNSPVYPQSIFIKNGQTVIPTTQEVLIAPKQKVSVDVIVKGNVDASASINWLTLPISFRAKP